jgi:integrase
MREASPGGYADRTRALIAILSRAGLRISEALALTESDLDARPREQAGRETGNEQRRTEAVPGTGEVRADLARAQRRIDTDEQHAEPGTVDGTERRWRRSLVLHKPDGTRRPVF